MYIPTEDQYLSAIETVKAYELHKDIIFQEKVKEVKLDLDEFFKTTEIKSYNIKIEDWVGNKGVFIFPVEPYYDETYGGEYDDDLKEISNKHNIKVKMDSGIYCK